MTDIMERLKAVCNANKECPHAPCFGYCLPLEAADEIEQLRTLGDMLATTVQSLLQGHEMPEDVGDLLFFWEELRGG